jgi:hypothetical protein
MSFPNSQVRSQVISDVHLTSATINNVLRLPIVNTSTFFPSIGMLVYDQHDGNLYRGNGAIWIAVTFGDMNQWGSVGAYDYSAVLSGKFNTASEGFALVAGGFNNTASGLNSVVSGGGTVEYLNTFGNTASGTSSVVAGGSGNDASGTGSVISGGGATDIETNGNVASGDLSVVSGGGSNVASGDLSVVAGGGPLYVGLQYVGNVASGLWSVVSGGGANLASENQSVVSGGALNTAAGINSTVPGGLFNTASGLASFAAGELANAQDDNSFVWADGNPTSSTGAGSFTVSSTGGATFYSNGGHTIGVNLPPGGNSWASVSDRNVKENMVLLDGRDVLTKVDELNVYQYNYKGTDKKLTCRGPMAQDWHRQFPSGKNPLTIDTMDLDGITLAALKGLSIKVMELSARVDAQAETIATLNKRS